MSRSGHGIAVARCGSWSLRSGIARKSVIGICTYAERARSIGHDGECFGLLFSPSWGPRFRQPACLPAGLAPRCLPAGWTLRVGAGPGLVPCLKSETAPARACRLLAPSPGGPPPYLDNWYTTSGALSP